MNNSALLFPSLIFLTRISRPRFWLYLAGPFLFGTIVAVRTVDELATPVFFLWLLFFLIPANVFLYSINDRYDADTDRFNAKKGTKEHLLRTREHRTLVTGLLASVVLYAFAFTYLMTRGETALALLLLALLLLSAGYSVPPVRFKARPFLDMLSNSLYLVPGVFGYVLYAEALPSWSILLALVCWTSAMQLYSAVPDIDADRKARLRTTAVVLGERPSLVLCMALWIAFVVILAFTTSLGWLLAFAAIYILLPVLPLLAPAVSVERLYWYYPWITGILGFLFWWYVALNKGGLEHLKTLLGF